MHSATGTRNATEMRSVIAMQSATGKLGPDRVRPGSMKPLTVMEERVVFATKLLNGNI
jgi:hypothetical protein